MNEHFLAEIEIKQFKCFTNFKASGFRRVNMIGGQNNNLWCYESVGLSAIPHLLS
jgi:hypothetical protein